MESGALMRTRRTEDGAEKWALRFFRREEETLGLYFIVVAVVMETAARVCV